MSFIYRVNMSDLTVEAQEPSAQYRDLGGRALTSTIVAAEVPPLCHPLSASNKLILAPGILSGTGAPCAGRISAGAKSPLTGTIKESNAGGQVSNALVEIGVKAIVLEGQPAGDKWYRLIVSSTGVKIEPAPELVGLGNYDTVAKEFARFGNKVTCITIGPAGEMGALAASIAVSDVEGRPTRHCGRGGLGAVMGSKRVKSIVIDSSGGKRPTPASAEPFMKGMQDFNKILVTYPLTSKTLPTYGTNILMNVLNAAGGLPTRNFTEGQFEGAEAVSGERQHDLIVERKGKIAHACHRGCTIRCSRLYNDEEGNFLSKGPEYETVWSHGPNCGLADLDAITKMDRIEDDLGLDTIEIGAAMAVAMAGGVIPFGDKEGMFMLLDEISKRTPLGRIIAAGTETVGRVYGVSHIPTCKGQAMPAYDPRALQGIGVTYATTTQGADHTAGYTVTANILGVGGKVEPLSPEGQVELSRNLQIATAAIDSAGLCLFVAFAVLDVAEAMEAICGMFTGVYGRDFAANDFLELGKQTLSIERKFNQAAGFNAAHDRLPEFFYKEKLPPHQTTFTVPDEEMDQVYNFVK
jgi:aldehyde:ferredoxin oxidoreductase